MVLESEVYTDFLSLVRAGVGHALIFSPSGIDWVAVRTLAEQQGLYAVVLDGIERLPEKQRPPQEFLLEWIGEVLQNYEYRYDVYKNTIAEMAGFYNSHGYKMMVLKGYACGLNWPKPNHRPCGDIDIWQFGKQKEADDAVANEKKIKIDNSHQHHTIFNWGEFTVENHYDFIDVHHRKTAPKLEKIFKELGQDDSHFVEINGEKVYLPSVNLHALFLVYHTMLHFTSTEMSIRQILDWGLFVEKHTKEIDWDWLTGLIKELHLNDFFNVINAICVKDLGFSTRIFYSVQFNPSLKDRILNDTLNPEFTGEEPAGLLSRILFRFRRWKSHEWKHKLCYEESMWSIFWTSAWAHLLKPKTI